MIVPSNNTFTVDYVNTDGENIWERVICALLDLGLTDPDDGHMYGVPTLTCDKVAHRIVAHLDGSEPEDH